MIRKTIIVALCLLLMSPLAHAGKKKTKASRTKVPAKFSCSKGIEPLWRLAMLNPYDNKGRCFEYMGASLQLLSRTSALYSYFYTSRKPAALIMFFGESAPLDFRGIVGGLGAFRYETVAGAINTIHLLAAIPEDKAVELYRLDELRKEKEEAKNKQTEKDQTANSDTDKGDAL
jgi:hypothetical protein